MEVVLGVSMTPAAVRMVLVEGADADGVTVDHHTRPIAPGDAVAEQVVAAILGTRDGAPEGGHRLVSTGVAWSDHAVAARLSAALRTRGIDDVVLVSELHAAGALARAVGRKTGRERTALLLTDRDIATLAVVRSSDGAVVKVHTAGSVADLLPMVAVLHELPEPPEAVFVVGSGVDPEAVKAQLASRTPLPVHAPVDAELALARGAALACAGLPRFEAETIGIGDFPTEAASTQPAAAYASAAHAPALGYSEVPAEDPWTEAGADQPVTGSSPKPFAVAGSAVAALFTVGVIALGSALALAVRPATDQPGPVGTASLPVSAPAAPETIEAPVPVARQEPRTVFVTPAPAAPQLPGPVPAAPPVIDQRSAPPAAAPPAPVQVPAPAAAPVPVPAAVPVAPAPAVVPILTPWTSILQLPARAGAPAQQSPAPPTVVTPTTPSSAPVSTAPVTSTPAVTSEVSEDAPAPTSESPDSTVPAPVTTTVPPTTAAATTAETASSDGA